VFGGLLRPIRWVANTSGMTIRTKFRVAVALWVIGCAAVLGLAQPRVAQAILIPGVFVVGLYTLALRCPRCKKPVLHNPVSVFGYRVWIWTSRIPPQCTQCGEPMP
jgi:hypothetical protein